MIHFAGELDLPREVGVARAEFRVGGSLPRGAWAGQSEGYARHD
jgi:hypothetical protein